MLANQRTFRYCSLSLFFVLGVSSAHAAVAYISNCCQYPSTVTVIDTRHEQPAAQWTVGNFAFAAVFSPDGKKAYISDEVSLNITVVKAATGATMATIPVGYSVQWMALTPDGRHLFVESFDSASISHLIAIDTANNIVTRTLTFNGTGPIVVSPDGKTLYVNGTVGKKSGLLAIDPATLVVKSAVPLYAPVSVALTPDGRYAYVPNFGSFQFTPNLAVVDTSTHQVVTNIPLDQNLDPSFVQISPDGSMAWVSEFPQKRGTNPAITVVQTSTNQVVGQITLLHNASPGQLVFAPSGERVYVTASGSGVDIVDVASMKAISEITVPGLVIGPAISPDGTTLLLPNSGTSRAIAVDQASGNPLASIPVGDMDLGSQLYLEYGGAAVSPDGSRAYVTNYLSNNVSVIDTASKKVVANVPVGDEPLAVVVSPDGSKVYVANSFSNSVTVIDTGTLATKRIRVPYSTYPSALTITPDGSRLYVAGDNSQPDFGGCRCYVFAIDTAAAKVVSSIKLRYPVALGSSPDSSKVYAVASGTGLYTISTATNKIIGSLTLASNGNTADPVSGGVVVTPDGKRLFATDGQDGSVFEVDLTTKKLVKTILVGSSAGNLALTPDGAEVWVADYYSPSVSVIDVSSGTVNRTIGLGNPSYGIAFAPQ